MIRADRTEENENTADLRQDYYDYYTEYEDYEEEDEDLVCCHKADVVAPEETDCTNLEDHVYVNRIYHLKIKVQYIESFIYFDLILSYLKAILLNAGVFLHRNAVREPPYRVMEATE